MKLPPDWFGRWGTSVFSENTAIFSVWHFDLNLRAGYWWVAYVKAEMSHVMRLWFFSSPVNHSSNMHVQPSSGARYLIFGRTLRLLPYIMCEQCSLWQDCALRRLAWAFVGRLCDKYHNLMNSHESKWCSADAMENIVFFFSKANCVEKISLGQKQDFFFFFFFPFWPVSLKLSISLWAEPLKILQFGQKYVCVCNYHVHV